MAEMTPAELTGAIKALTDMLASVGLNDAAECWLIDKRTDYEEQLAAQPPAVDRERRLRGALENYLAWQQAKADFNLKFESASEVCEASDALAVEAAHLRFSLSLQAALADQPPPDQRETALEKAENVLESVNHIGAISWNPALKGCVVDALAAIRAARGKA